MTLGKSKYLIFIEKFKSCKNIILEDWFQVVIDSYPKDASLFMKNQDNFFSNPVGQNIFNNLDRILDGLINDDKIENFNKFIDPIIRIRAVQGFQPSISINFVFDLKSVLRRHIKTTFLEDCDLCFYIFEKKIDELIKIAFDIFLVCREQIYDLKANEARNQFFSSLKRAGLIAEV